MHEPVIVNLTVNIYAPQAPKRQRPVWWAELRGDDDWDIPEKPVETRSVEQRLADLDHDITVMERRHG